MGVEWEVVECNCRLASAITIEAPLIVMDGPGIEKPLLDSAPIAFVFNSALLMPTAKVLLDWCSRPMELAACLPN